jgi:hypothetical protein
MDDYQWEMSTLSGENVTTKQVTQRAINKRQGFTNARQPPFYNANPFPHYSGTSKTCFM